VSTLSPEGEPNPQDSSTTHPGQDRYFDPALLWILVFGSGVILAVVTLVVISALSPVTSGVAQTAISGTLGIGGGVITYATLRRRPGR
jgi:hypothetical protein